MEKYNLNNIISPEYLQLIRGKFSSDIFKWGGAVTSSIPYIYFLTQLSKSKNILDFGAGSSHFKIGLNELYPNNSLNIIEFEPGREELFVEPPICDLTVCVDVLEHIEYEKIDNVINFISSKTNNALYFRICKVPAKSNFPNGQNLHLIVEDDEYWKSKLEPYFTLYDTKSSLGHFWGVAIKK